MAKTGRPRVPQDKVERAMQMFAEGRNLNEIAEGLGIDWSSARRIIAEADTLGGEVSGDLASQNREGAPVNQLDEKARYEKMLQARTLLDLFEEHQVGLVQVPQVKEALLVVQIAERWKTPVARIFENLQGMDDLYQNVAQLEAQAEEAKKRLADLGQQESEMAQRIEEKERQAARRESEMRQRIGQIAGELEQAESELAAKSRELQEIERDIEQVNDYFGHVMKACSLRAYVEYLKASAAQLGRTVSERQSLVREAEAFLARLRAQQQEEQQRLESTATEANEGEQRLARLVEAAREVAGQLEELSEERDRVAEQVNGLRVQLAQMEETVAERRKQVQELDEKLTEQRQVLDEVLSWHLEEKLRKRQHRAMKRRNLEQIVQCA